jgi:hypothetical protein
VKILSSVILVCLGLFGNAAVAGIGFQTGDRFTSHRLEGDITVTCFNSPNGGGIEMHSEHCVSEILDPAASDFFVYDEEIDANVVQLNVTQATGKKREQSKDFDSQQGKSKRRFNLWFNTLFQRPLLDHGNNQVDYVFKKDRNVVRQGRFDVQVDRGAGYECPRRSYTSNFDNDCQYGAYCGRYFRDENYCQPVASGK